MSTSANKSIDFFVNKMIVDMYNEYDISRAHILESYSNTIKDYDDEHYAKAQAIKGYIRGFYTMLDAYNKSSGIEPMRSLEDYYDKNRLEQLRKNSDNKT